MSERPLVSVIVPAYNLARFLPAAIESALTQVDPGGPVEVIVVDDGSEDETPAVLSSFGDRIRSVRQPNRGLVTAVDHGLGLVQGRYVALLDADDELPADRLSRHVRALEQRPTVGLVHGDMEVIDADGTVTSTSFFADQKLAPAEGRILGSLLAGNSVTGGAATFRASLLGALHPIAGNAAYPDWWIGACIAAVAEIGLVEGSANRYRFHGANMGLGSGADKQPQIQRQELPWRRWMFEHLLADDSIGADALANAYAAMRFGLLVATTAAPNGARSLFQDVTPSSDRPLPPSGRGAPRSRELLRRYGRDPFDGAVMIDLELALRQEATLGAAPASAPLIALARNRPRLTLARVSEVLERPELLHAFASERSEASASTLVLLAEPGIDPSPLVRMFESDPLLRGDLIDAQLLAAPTTTPARRLLSAWSDALLSSESDICGIDGVPASPALERLDVPVAPKPVRTPSPRGSEQPRVSVVVPCYNAAATLAETVASVLAQTLQEIELIIVDDGSTDDSVALARSLAAAHDEIPITVVEIPHSGHPAVPRNTGLARARADLLTCLDPDDLFTPEYLERCVATLDARPEVGFTFGDLHSFGGESRLWPREEYDFHELTRRNLIGANGVFRREVYTRSGGFDPTLPYEDWQFWIQCGALGYLGAKTSGALWRYRVRADSRFRTFGSPRDRSTKASFVVRRPGLYSAAQQLWARAVLDQDPLADTVVDELGVIPELRLRSTPTRLARLPAPTRRAQPEGVTQPPRASIVIVAKDAEAGLASGIDQALAQSPPGGTVEVIVVDCSDAPLSVTEAPGSGQVRVIEGAGLTRVRAIEAGLSEADGEYIAVLQPPDAWPQDRMLRHVALLEGDQSLAAIGDSRLDALQGPTSAVTFRRSLLPVVIPIPEALVDIDNWFGQCAADVARFGTSDESEVRASIEQSGTSPLLFATRPTIWLASLADVLSDRALLDLFRREGAADPELTLAVIAGDGADLTPLVELVDADPRLRDERVDITVIDEPSTEPARRLLAARCTRILGSFDLGAYEPVTSA